MIKSDKVSAIALSARNAFKFFRCCKCNKNVAKNTFFCLFYVKKKYVR